jgi:hypothetical protein
MLFESRADSAGFLKRSACLVDARDMARLISGVLLIIWGLALLVSGFVRDVDGDGAYAAGQVAGWLFGFVLLALGVRAVVKSRVARR